MAQANLYDQFTLDGSNLATVNRNSLSGGAGFTATNVVFWNTFVTRNHPQARGCAVETAQFAWGYAIGSRAAGTAQAKLCSVPFSNNSPGHDPGWPMDFIEGEGKGATLFPQSL